MPEVQRARALAPPEGMAQRKEPYPKEQQRKEVMHK
jgi:hypothetical protein